MKKLNTKKLEKILQKAQVYSLISIFFAGSGHPGGILSCMDLIVYLYLTRIKIKNINQFKSIDRDRFILSKGHSSSCNLFNIGSIKDS